MKPQSKAFLERAGEVLGQAEKILGIDLNEAAGRTAYLAGYHAAQALPFEHSDKTFKNSQRCSERICSMKAAPTHPPTPESA